MFLLLVFGKIFEGLTYNNSNCLIENDLISPNQSFFLNQRLLASITYCLLHKHHSFGNWFEVWGVFFDISNVFDKVWSRIYKLKQNGGNE